MGREIIMTNNYQKHRQYHRGIDKSRAKLFDYISEGESVLDVGCGSGWVWENFKEAGHDVKFKGVDLTKNFIEGAKIDFPEVEWEVQNAQELKEEDDSWDNVLLYHVLELCPDWQKAVEEALRVAKKRVIINFWHGYTDYNVKLVTQYAQEREYDYLEEQNSNWIGKREIEKFMEEHGFEKEPTETIKIFPNTYHYFVLEKDGKD